MTSEIDRDSLTDEEREALEGEDVGSLSDAEAAAKAAEAIADEPPGDPPAVEPAAEAAVEEAIAPRLVPQEIDGHDEKLNELLDQRKAIREQYRNGDLSADEKDQQEDAINDQIADLRASVQQRAFVENYNAQMAEQDYVRTIAAVKADIRRNDGIDYDKNPMLLQNWDLKVRTLASDPANADKPGRWYLEEAHRRVLAEVAETAKALGFTPNPRGLRPATPDETVGEAVRARRQPVTTKSLAGLPAAAADSGHEGAEFTHLDHLSGDDLENAVARMTPEQQERWARA